MSWIGTESRTNSDLVRALAAYNSGPERVEQCGGIPPFRETRAYVRRVTQNLSNHKNRKRTP